MNDDEIRWKIVRRLWNDGIVEASRYADIDTVADFAVPASDEGRACQLIEDEMVSDSDCPVVWGIAGQAITLRMDREAVARYIRTYGGQESLPWDLKDVLTEEDGKTAEIKDTG